MPKLALDQWQRDPLVKQLHRVGMPELVLVPTSAQTPLCRRRCYAQFDPSLAGIPGSRRVEVGIVRPIRRALAVASHWLSTPNNLGTPSISGN